MPTDDRKDTNDEIRAHVNPPIEGLAAKPLDEGAAEQVKGGGIGSASTGVGAGKIKFNEFQITKTSD